AFSAVSTLAEETLHNTAPDQAYDPEHNDWGYTYTEPTDYKISVLGGDPAEGTDLAALGKYELGVRTNSDRLSFYLALEGGTYTLSSGFYEFYATEQERYRLIDQTLSYTVDGEQQSQRLSSLPLSTAADHPENVLDTAAF